ncbi:hypothetical protein F444_20337 [Phytophthora nicotianae P1976]|uniref:Uncharacterized protein n=1 Tax=Phytophthora nicotianae P1976 TaxID=1317066 RepID=A0A080Z4X3_PHYNI|nr:hypothetical protein F444_20337 [Phytophthora nicotianae P1976]
MSENGHFESTPASRIEYLTGMTARLSTVIRDLKVQQRPNEFNLSQASMLTGSSFHVRDTVNLIDGHFGCLEDSESFDLYLDWSGLLKGSEKWGYIGRFPRMENDILLYMTLMGDHKLEQSTLRPLHAPVHMVLKRTFFRDGSIINSVTKSNNGPNLETLLLVRSFLLVIVASLVELNSLNS